MNNSCRQDFLSLHFSISPLFLGLALLKAFKGRIKEKKMEPEILTVTNKVNMHMRTAQKIIEAITPYPDCALVIIHKGREINARSVIFIMSAAMKTGDECQLKASGPGSAEALEAVANLFNDGFGEL
jgi:phosphotransferase system HPr (HPr) family protein